MNKNFPCTCGHEKEKHDWEKYIKKYICVVKNPNSKVDYDSPFENETGWGRWADTCMDYTPDNLKYLEQIYDDKANKQ